MTTAPREPLRVLAPGAAPRAEYLARVNRVIDHVERNLREPLSLARLADVAHLSRFHFHRVFKAMVGETVAQFVLRLRVEKAALLLANPRNTVTGVALDCGFSSPATFARAFKAAYGVSATIWRQQRDAKICDPDRNNRKQVRSQGNVDATAACYIDPRTAKLTWRLEMTTDQPLAARIDVQHLPERNVAYLRHTGPYGNTGAIPVLYKKLRAWIHARELLTPDTLALLVAHDSPNFTDARKLRLSVCMTVPRGTAVEGEVGTMAIPGGKFAVARFEIVPDMIAQAWGAVMGNWLPDSGYQPDDRLCYEIPRNNPTDHPEGKIVLDICVPVKPL